MRLGGRLGAAIEILDDIEVRHRPVAAALKDWGLAHRFAGSGDRAAIGNIVYDALRRRLSIAHRMGADDAAALAFGAVLEGWGRSAEDIAAELEGDRFAPDPPPGLARAAADDPQGNVAADIPEWCVAHFENAFGDDWIGEASGLARRPPLDLRANRLKADRDRVLKALGGSGASPARLAPDGLRIAPTSGPGRHPNVQAEPAFQKGWFEVQDEGSQIAALLAGAEPGMQVLDLCAGAGGKTLALSAAMENSGQIFAFDADKTRLAPIFDRLKRAGSRNVQAFADAATLDDRKGRMDLVLVDAPCTGSGTWRRRPDAKWRLTPEQLAQRTREQAALLAQAAGFVKPGGRLAYVTCSVFAAENDDRIAGFLGGAAEFSAADHGALWRERFAEFDDCARRTAHGLMLTPARTGTDGFFVSILRRAMDD